MTEEVAATLDVLKDLFKAAEDDLINFNIERCMGAAIVFTLTLTWPNFDVNSREVHFYFRLISGDKLRAVWRNQSIFWTSDDPFEDFFTAPSLNETI